MEFESFDQTLIRGYYDGEPLLDDTLTDEEASYYADMLDEIPIHDLWIIQMQP
jgi:hypothetical protein